METGYREFNFGSGGELVCWKKYGKTHISAIIIILSMPAHHSLQQQIFTECSQNNNDRT
jgi:hypothetical protein